MKISIERLGMEVTLLCNLRCKQCVMNCPEFTQYYNKSLFIDDGGGGGGYYMSLREEKETLKITFSLIDRIHSLQISGGEPLLVHNIPKIVQECFEYSNSFDELLLFTNATIPLKDEFIAVLKNIDNKFKFYISNYGIHKEKVNAFIQKLQSNNINYIEIKYYGEDQHCGGFVDYGKYERHSRTPEELKSLFLSCAQAQTIRCHPTMNGHIHYCPFALGGTERNLIPSKINVDYLDIFDPKITMDEKRDWFRKIRSVDYITACEYCSGDFGTTDISKRHPAGEQKDCNNDYN
jgi:organic radical activating enzyme